MNPKEIRQITAGRHKVGIIGLETALKDLANIERKMTDDEIQNELIKALSKNNYISENVKPEYGKAFLIEFKKFVGLPIEDDRHKEQIEIKVLGRGCNRCDQLMQDVMGVASELNLKADIDHIKDLKEIGKFGAVGTPALVINGKIKSMGHVPSKLKIKAWLKE
jgi:small redox-active disulfide protein 2